jgi:chemotaxis protein CheX
MVSSEDIHSIVDSVWQSLFGASAEPRGPVDSGELGTVMHASIQITGAWNGAVVLTIPRDLAEACASTMFDSAPGTAKPEEIADAVGELVNMVGGNVKSLVEQPSQLSLPTVVDGAVHSLSIPGSKVVHALWFEADGHPFSALLHEGTR